MINFTLTEKMKELIMRAKAAGGATTCDPRKMYPVGNVCAATTSPILATRPPQYIKLGQPIDAGGVPVPPDARIIKARPLPTGGAVIDIETKSGETVEATTAANGAVKKVEVKNKLLIPAAIAAAFFLLGG